MKKIFGILYIICQLAKAESIELTLDKPAHNAALQIATPAALALYHSVGLTPLTVDDSDVENNMTLTWPVEAGAHYVYKSDNQLLHLTLDQSHLHISLLRPQLSRPIIISKTINLQQPTIIAHQDFTVSVKINNKQHYI